MTAPFERWPRSALRSKASCSLRLLPLKNATMRSQLLMQPLRRYNAPHVFFVSTNVVIRLEFVPGC